MRNPINPAFEELREIHKSLDIMNRYLEIEEAVTFSANDILIGNYRSYQGRRGDENDEISDRRILVQSALKEDQALGESQLIFKKVYKGGGCQAAQRTHLPQPPKQDDIYLNYAVHRGHTPNNRFIDVWSFSYVVPINAVRLAFDYHGIRQLEKIRRNMFLKSNETGSECRSCEDQATVGSAVPPNITNSKPVHRYHILAGYLTSCRYQNPEFEDRGDGCPVHKFNTKCPRATGLLDYQPLPQICKILPFGKVRAYKAIWSYNKSQGSRINVCPWEVNDSNSPNRIKSDDYAICSATKRTCSISMFALSCIQVGCWSIMNRYHPEDGRSIVPMESPSVTSTSGLLKYGMIETTSNRFMEMADSQFPSLRILWPPVFADLARNPTPTAFLAACVVFAVATALFQHLRQENRFQKQFLLLGTIAIVLLCALQDNAMRLQQVLPGCIVITMPLSILVHWLGRCLESAT